LNSKPLIREGFFVYDEKVKSHTLAIADTVIEVREYGRADRPTVLAIQGWGNTLERADAFIEALAKSFHLYTFILPGYGKSLPDARSQSTQFLADLIDPICEQLEITPHLVGYSLGTIILSRYLADHPQYNRKVVLIGAPMVRTHKPLTVHLASLPYIRGVFRRSLLLRVLIINQSRVALKAISVKKKRKLWMKPTHEATTEGLFDTIITALNTFPDPRQLPQMIAYIYGKEDPLIPEKNVPSNMTIVPSAGHLILYEQPVVLAQTVRKVLSEPLWPCAPEM
jgi:pimeloyl-ACP methyl ester carboxylesterase